MGGSSTQIIVCMFVWTVDFFFFIIIIIRYVHCSNNGLVDILADRQAHTHARSDSNI